MLLIGDIYVLVIAILVFIDDRKRNKVK